MASLFTIVHGHKRNMNENLISRKMHYFSLNSATNETQLVEILCIMSKKPRNGWTIYVNCHLVETNGLNFWRTPHKLNTNFKLHKHLYVLKINLNLLCISNQLTQPTKFWVEGHVFCRIATSKDKRYFLLSRRNMYK